MKKIFLLLYCISIISCEKKEDIPSFIKVDSIYLNYNEDFGSNTENITDVWIYIEDNLQGVYEIPVVFPVLDNGIKNIRVKAGIKANGIASTRVQYPFYTSYLDTISLVKDEVVEINPNFSYNTSFEAIKEDFENPGTIIDSTINSELDFTIVSENNNKYGFVEILSPSINFEIATENLMKLDKTSFEQEINKRSADILGHLKLVSEPQLWKMRTQVAKRLISFRAVIIAEAAHVLPPIGAQGFNMSINDIKCLLKKSINNKYKLGEPRMLLSYERERLVDMNFRVSSVSLLNYFSKTDNPFLRIIRSSSIKYLFNFNPLKSTIMKLGLGSQ